MNGLRNLAAAAVLVAFAAAGVGQEKLKFEPKFELNKPFFQQVTTDVDQTVKVEGGNDLKLKHSQTFLFKWTPIKQDGDKWTVKMAIEGVKLKVEVAGNPVNYDSTSDQPNANNPGLNEFFKSLIGSEFSVTYGKGMVVEKVEGKDALLKTLGSANQQMENLLKRVLSDESLKEMSDPLAGLTPGVEKGVGEKWDKTSPIKLGPIGEYERKLSFDYKGKDPERKDLERIEVKSTLTYKPPTGDADGLLFRIKGGELNTVTTGTPPAPSYYLFDAKTGMLKDARLTVAMNGTLNVAIGTTETKVSLNQVQTTTVQTQDKSFLPEKK